MLAKLPHAWIWIIVVATTALAQPAPSASRGELLYNTHCIACHTAEVHWRQQKLATDWTSLERQVRRWAGNTGLAWSDEEIVDVARYVNAAYYHFAAPSVTGDADYRPPLPIARVGSTRFTLLSRTGLPSPT
jgi:mono/diheme cytochrome c family protein